MGVGSANQDALTYFPTLLTGNKKLGQKIADPLNVFGWQSSDIQAPTLTGPPAQASDINLNPSLTKTLGTIGTGAQGKISDIYGRMRTQMASDARPKSVGPGSYADQRFTTGQGISNKNLGAGLENVLGNEGYESWKNQRDFNQNMALANYTGALNKPSLLEQALGGLSGGAQLGGQGYGLYQSLKKKKNNNGVLAGDTPSAYTQTSTLNDGSGYEDIG